MFGPDENDDLKYIFNMCDTIIIDEGLTVKDYNSKINAFKRVQSKIKTHPDFFDIDGKIEEVKRALCYQNGKYVRNSVVYIVLSWIVDFLAQFNMYNITTELQEWPGVLDANDAGQVFKFFWEQVKTIGMIKENEKDLYAGIREFVFTKIPLLIELVSSVNVISYLENFQTGDIVISTYHRIFPALEIIQIAGQQNEIRLLDATPLKPEWINLQCTTLDKGDPRKTTETQVIIVDNKTDANIWYRTKTGDKILLDRVFVSAVNVCDVFNNLGEYWVWAPLRERRRIVNELKARGMKVGGGTHHRSDQVRGIKCDARLALFVGIPYAPGNAYLALAYSMKRAGFIDEEIEDWVKKITKFDAGATLLQELSRHKDPNGKDASTVVLLGVKYDEIISLFTDLDYQPVIVQPTKFWSRFFYEIPRLVFEKPREVFDEMAWLGRDAMVEYLSKRMVDTGYPPSRILRRYKQRKEFLKDFQLGYPPDVNDKGLLSSYKRMCKYLGISWKMYLQDDVIEEIA
jgi:hypothetical protein